MNTSIKLIKKLITRNDYRHVYFTISVLGGDEPWLLLANIKSIRLVSLNGKVYSYIFSKLSRTIALDFDFSDQKLYWTDVAENAIHSRLLQVNESGAYPGKVGILFFTLLILKRLAEPKTDRSVQKC